MFGLGCFLILTGIASFALGQRENAVGVTVLGSSYVAFLLLSPRISIRKQIKSTPHLFEEGEYDFDDKQFQIIRPSVQLAMSWNNVHSAVELQRQFVIYTTKTCFFSVPKRFFSDDQLSSVRELLTQVLQARGKTFHAA
ncbi:YcxB family protein [Paludibaculum fermentans]